MPSIHHGLSGDDLANAIVPYLYPIFKRALESANFGKEEVKIDNKELGRRIMAMPRGPDDRL